MSSVRVVVSENAEDDSGVLDRACEPAHGIERPRDGHDAVAADESEGGLDADDARVCGGAQDGSGGLRSEGHREHPRGGTGGGTTAGTAGSAVEVPWVLRGRGLEHGELSCDGLSEHNTTRLLEQGHGGGVVVRNEAFVDLGAPRRCDALSVVDVLGAEGDAVQGTYVLAVGQLSCALGSGIARGVFVKVHPHV